MVQLHIAKEFHVSFVETKVIGSVSVDARVVDNDTGSLVSHGIAVHQSGSSQIELNARYFHAAVFNGIAPYDKIVGFNHPNAFTIGHSHPQVIVQYFEFLRTFCHG